jgi:hypothetical protein
MRLGRRYAALYTLGTAAFEPHPRQSSQPVATGAKGTSKPPLEHRPRIVQLTTTGGEQRSGAGTSSVRYNEFKGEHAS